MKKVIVSLLSNLLLALVWVALTGDFAAWNLAMGFLLGLAVLSLTGRESGAHYVKKMQQFVRFVLFFLWELVLANVRVAFDVMTPRHRAKPGFLAVPLEAESDLEIALLANLITLTPGTLSLDVSADRKYLLLHAMFVEDPEDFKRSIKREFESRILELLR